MRELPLWKGLRGNRTTEEKHERYQGRSKQLGTRLARASRKCEITPWGSQRSYACGSEIWTSTTSSFSSVRIGWCKLWVWRIPKRASPTTWRIGTTRESTARCSCPKYPWAEELKRAQEMRVDEFSRNELRESRAVVQELTSQIQELQERMNDRSDSRELQDIGSMWCGKLSHVPSQLAVVPCPRSMFSRDQSLQLDTWNLSGTQGNVSGNPRAMLDSSQIPYQGILHFTNQSATGGILVQRSTGRPVAKGEELTGSIIAMPIFARRPSTMNSFAPAELSQNSMAGQQRLRISELHFDKFTTPSTFSCW